MALGESGYLDLAQRAISITDVLIQGVSSLDGLYVLGQPDMNVFAFASDIIVFKLFAFVVSLEFLFKINSINSIGSSEAACFTKFK